MAVKNVQWQTHLSRSGNQNDGTGFAEEFFVIECDADADTTAIQGASFGGIAAPIFGSTHPTASLYCNQTEYTPMSQNTRRVFQCRADYSDDPIVDPLTLPPAIEWDFSEDGDVPYFLDCSSTPKPVTNSAGELFQDYLTRANGAITASFSINLTPGAAASMASTLTQYTYPVTAVNSGGITFDGLTLNANQARIKGANISALTKQLVFGTYVQFRTVKFNLAFKANWQDKIDDRGFNQKWTSNADGSVTLKEIVKGVPPTKPDRPWPLDGNGNAKPNITDMPSQLTFQPYPQMSFSVFNFS
jgi:hypothetical protein